MIKMNKKGFTLIEMLVVIAIIAILVSIIIPTVQSATDKAAAATNAANLRSVKAELVTAMLTGDESICEVPTTSGAVTIKNASKPYAKPIGGITAKDVTPSATYNATDKSITVYYGNAANTIDAFAKVASGEQKPNTIQ